VIAVGQAANPMVVFESAVFGHALSVAFAGLERVYSYC